MRGRKPKPTRLKVIEGNPGHRPINGREPKPPASQPSCPAHLSPTAKAEWKRLARTLNKIGILTQVDRAALAAYCQAYGLAVLTQILVFPFFGLPAHVSDALAIGAIFTAVSIVRSDTLRRAFEAVRMRELPRSTTDPGIEARHTATYQTRSGAAPKVFP